MKNWKETCQQAFIPFDMQERKQNFAICMVEKFQTPSGILTSIKQLPNKINSKFLHKNRALLFWVPTLIICLRVDEFGFTIMRLFPQHQIFFEKPCVTHAFILLQQTSKVDLWNNTYFHLHDFVFFLWQTRGVFMTPNHLFFSDYPPHTIFVFQHKRTFELVRTPRHTSFSSASVISVCHQFSRAHATLRMRAHKCSIFRYHMRCTWYFCADIRTEHFGARSLLVGIHQKIQNMSCVSLLCKRD